MIGMSSTLIARLRNQVARFARNDRGNFYILSAFLAVPLVFTAGAAIDLAEIYRARTNFQNAVDASALMAGKTLSRTGDIEKAGEAGERVFQANIANLAPSQGDVVFTFPSNDCGAEGVTADATLRHKLFFPAARRIANSWYGTTLKNGGKRSAGYKKKKEFKDILLGVSSTVKCANAAVEVVMVLDNSGSMSRNGKIDALKFAATRLIDSLGSTMGNDERPEDLKFGLVPFSTFVNVGSDNADEDWIDKDGVSPIHHENFNWGDHPTLYTNDGDGGFTENRTSKRLTRLNLYEELGLEWEGCVETRPYPYSTNDEEPDQTEPSTMIVPVFAPDTPDNWSNFNRYQYSYVAAQPHCDEWKWKRSRGRWEPDGCNRWSDGERGRRHPTTRVRAYYYSAEYDYRGVWQGSTGGAYSWIERSSRSEKDYENNYLSDGHNHPGLYPSAYSYLQSNNPNRAMHIFDEDNMGSANGNQFKRQSWGWKYLTDASGRRPNPNPPSVLQQAGGPSVGCTVEPLTPLTSDRDVIKTKVSEMVATGATNVHQGTAWGWRVLSPEPPFEEGESYEVADNKKVMIVMTDGNNTYYPTDYFYGNYYGQDNGSYYGAYGHARNRRIFDGFDDIANPQDDFDTYTKAMDSHLLKTCTNAKKAGIAVYTIAFDVPNGSSVKEKLETCASTNASGEPLYFPAENNNELLAAFEKIAENIAALRLAM